MSNRDALYRLAFHGQPPVIPPLGDADLRFLQESMGTEPLPLNEIQLEVLQAQLTGEPALTRAAIRRTVDTSLSDDEIDALISKTRTAFATPAAAVPWIEAIPLGLGRTQLPADFTFPGIDEGPGRASIEPRNYQFETARDWLGWVVQAGPYWLRERATAPRTPFRWAEDYPSNFIYDHTESVPGVVTVGLFSDAGTGLYTSRYIAHHLVTFHRPELAFHLGDVYYAGKASEFNLRFATPLRPLSAQASFWALNANHEMLSKGAAYFAYLDAKRTAAQSVPPHQEGSYFALRLAGYQIVGIDTAYHDDGRQTEPRLQSWLEDRLREGRDRDLVNILLTSNEPYGLGDAAAKDLLGVDLATFAARGLVDLWFWGNTHYCALFDRSAKTPFVGSCIGHGGYPYARVDEDAQSKHNRVGLNAARFVETRARFPERTEVRQDRGNNGYVVLQLSKDSQPSIELVYFDWMRSESHRARLRRSNGTLSFTD